MPKRPKFRDKSVRPARGDLADRHPLSSSIHRDHSIRLRLCSYLPGMSIDRWRPAAGARFAIGRRPAFGVRHGSLRIARTFQDAESEETVLKSARKITSDHLKDIPVTFVSFRRRVFARETQLGLDYWPQTVSCVCGHRWGRSLRPVRVRFVQSGDLGIYQ